MGWKHNKNPRLGAGVRVWSEPLWDGNGNSGRRWSNNPFVWSEPLWDGNNTSLTLPLHYHLVWSEPLWDGNYSHPYFLLVHPCLIRTIVGWKLLSMAFNKRSIWFDPNHCGMETLSNAEHNSCFLFDPNHCGMETPYCRHSRHLLCLIRTIVGWKLKPFLISNFLYVWSEPLWDGNLFWIAWSGTWSYVWSEPLWDGNFTVLRRRSENWGLIRTIVGWKRTLWDKRWSCPSCLIRTIVGWKPFSNISLTSFTEFDPNHCGMETLALVLRQLP